MVSRKRQGNRVVRRVWPDAPLGRDQADRLISRCRYVGAPFHKLKKSDYDFMPSPRANKSLCDDVREIKWGEARELFKSGIRRGMVSFFDSDTIPKYVWAVDEQNEVYEAKTKPERENYYHGYRLGKNDRFRVHVLDMWKHR